MHTFTTLMLWDRVSDAGARSHHWPIGAKCQGDGRAGTRTPLLLRVGSVLAFLLGRMTPRKQTSKAWAFQGTIGGVYLEAFVIRLSSTSFQVNVQGSGINLSGVTNPVTIQVSLGTDVGIAALSQTTS